MAGIFADQVLAELARLRAAGSPCCLATVVRVSAPTSAKPGDKAVITVDGAMVGWIGGSCSEPSIRREALVAMKDGTPRVVLIAPENGEPAWSHAGEPHEDVVLEMSCPSGGALEIFLEPYMAHPQLVAIGRSPAAQTLIRLAADIGFRTCGVHPGARSEDFQDADQIIDSLDLADANIGDDSWIVVATMGHYDAEALEAALRTDAAYVGLIASRKRRNAVVQVLRKRGWPGDALSGIVNPAGRTLADAPEEIALSVLAEIVDRRIRRQKRLKPAADLETPPFATDPVCGMAVEIAGALYCNGDLYFCGPGCLEAFEAHPERYAVPA